MRTHSTQTPSRPNPRSTSLGILLAICVPALFSGVVSLPDSQLIENGQVTRVVQLAASLEEACRQHYADTGSIAYEYSDCGTAHRRLSATQNATGWNGPYIPRALSHSKNPWGGSCHLYKSARINDNPGFDTNGDGQADVGENASTLYLSDVDRLIAKQIDQAIDGGAEGEDWASSGRVNWLENKRLFILLFP